MLAGYQLLVKVNISQNKFSLAIQTCEKILAQQNDKDTLWQMARLLSWTNDFTNSIACYDRLIELDPEFISAYIEKARVLVWNGQYELSLQAYEEAYARFGLLWIKNELLGKKNLFNQRPESAVQYFEDSLAENPQNEEILFDLAQLFSQVGDYEKAQKYYELLIARFPYHTPGRSSQLKAQIRKDHLQAKVGYNLWQPTSAERMTELNLQTFYANLTKNLNNNWTLSSSGTKTSYAYPGSVISTETGWGVNLVYNEPLNKGAGGGITFKSLASGNPLNQFYSYYWQRLQDGLNLNINVNKDNLVNNFHNLANDVNDTYCQSSLTYYLDRIFTIQADVRFGFINDGNNYNIAGLNARINHLSLPLNLYSSWRIERQNYQTTSSFYYAPTAYFAYSGLLGFKHEIGPEGIFYGAKETYYEIICKIIYDSNQELALQPLIQFCHDATQSDKVRLALGRTTSKYYSDVTASFEYVKYL